MERNYITVTLCICYGPVYKYLLHTDSALQLTVDVKLPHARYQDQSQQ